jgi:hypothetical protein
VLLEAGRVRWNQNPALSGSRPNMPLHLDAGRIVECPAQHRPHVRSSLERASHRGAATRTELQPDPAAAFVGAMLVDREWAAGDLHILLPKRHPHAERATGAAPAKGAMADRRPLRLSSYSISYCAAKAATLLNFRHVAPPPDCSIAFRPTPPLPVPSAFAGRRYHGLTSTMSTGAPDTASSSTIPSFSGVLRGRYLTDSSVRPDALR